MAFITNAGNLAARKRILAGKVQERFRLRARMFGQEMVEIAKQLSGGPLSTSTIRRLGHPYAQMLPVNSAGIPDYIINKQTGLLQDSWQMRAQLTGNDWVVTIYNTAPYAQFMVGTHAMRQRAILDEVERRMQPIIKREVQKIMKQAVDENSGSSGGSSGGSFTSGGGAGSAWGAVGYGFAVGAASIASAAVDSF